jgi:glycosyltransferase involved in cell wall biosynthesis
VRDWNNIIVVPCYNEAARLRASAFGEFAAANPDTRLIFVDDCSVDSTVDVLRAIQSEVGSQIDVISLSRNMGKAEAVRAGMQAALEQEPLFAGFWDADLATPLDAVPQFRQILEQRPHVDLVLGSRVRLLGRTIQRSFLRHIIGRVFATAASTALRLPVYDTQCGAKLFRAGPRVRDLFAEPFISRWAFDVEVIARLLHSDPRLTTREWTTRFYELPLTRWEDVDGSKVRPLDFPRSMLDLLRIHRRYMRASNPKRS